MEKETNSDEIIIDLMKKIETLQNDVDDLKKQINPKKIETNKILTKEKILNLQKEDPYYDEAKWKFFYKPVIEELKKLEEIETVLEMGPYKAPFIENCDVLDYQDLSDSFASKVNKVIIHDCRKTPFPIEDKTYDLLIASQILEHLGYEGEQVEIFKEIARISKKAIIALPYKWIRPLARNHHMIDENVFDAWQGNFKHIHEKTNERIILRVYDFGD